jgi:hypothetical protein
MTRAEILEKFPNLIQDFRATHKMIGDAIMAGKKFTASGFSTTPPGILAEREATCRSCDQWDATALNNTGRCRKCGCSTWAKLRMATEACPLGKWEAATAAPEVLTGARE